MNINLSNYKFYEDFLTLTKLLGTNEVRLVGGVVRDIIIGDYFNDVDFATTLSVEEMINIFKENNVSYYETGLDHGTLTVSLNYAYEITTLRIDEKCDGRHAIVKFVTDWKLDASRRDFTINAMYIDIHGNVFDYFNGLEHIKNKKIIFVGDPIQRIKEDYLRFHRFLRFNMKYNNNFNFDETMKWCNLFKNELQLLPMERVSSELLKMASYDNFLNYFEKVRSFYEILIGKIISHNKKQNNVRFSSLTKIALVIYDVEKLRLSTKELKDIQTFRRYLKLSKFSIEDAYELFYIEKFSKHIINEISLYHNGFKFDIEDHEFPINGNDLISLGFQGKEIGEIIKKMKRNWIYNNFKITKEEIINNQLNL